MVTDHGVILYGLLRLILRKPLAKFIQPALNRLDPDDLDEISYRAIAIGFPVFTLGGLIFAMIWAEIAWGRFWGWDPKEVWALITWLFYSVYLHLRLSRGWQETLVLAVRYRLYRGHVYAGRRQLDYRGSAFLCGNRLIVNRIAVNDQSEGPFLNQEGHF